MGGCWDGSRCSWRGWGCMCGRCAPHGRCAPSYTGALESGSRQPVYPKGPAYSPDQQDRRLPARPAPSGWVSADGEEPRPPTRPARPPSARQASALKRGLGGNRNVHRRSEASAPPEEQDYQYTSGQRESLEPQVLSGFFAPFWPTKKGPAPGRGTPPQNLPILRGPRRISYPRAE